MTSRTRRQPTAEQLARKAAVQRQIKTLSQELKEGKHAATLALLLGKFDKYSPLNQLLIVTQCPHATEVASFLVWKQRGLQVRKGEKGIAIVAPHEYKGGSQEETRTGFHTTYVFDRSQVDPITEGEEDAQETEAPEEEERQVPSIASPAEPAPVLQSAPVSSASSFVLPKGEPVAPHILAVLQAAYFEGATLILPMQLERKSYTDTNKVLERIGGKWNRKAKGHLFEDEESPQDLLRLILETGEMPPKNPTSYYPSPQWLAERLAEAIPASARTILEPSAGTGSIARAIRDYCHWQKIEAQLDCCEILPKFQNRLSEQGFTVVAADFLSYRPQARYDVILMNPPYAVEGDPVAYVTHVLHAWNLLAEGGVLKSVVASGLTFRQDKRVAALRELVEEVGEWQELPRDTFKQSAGTSVNTVLLEMRK